MDRWTDRQEDREIDKEIRLFDMLLSKVSNRVGEAGVFFFCFFFTMDDVGNTFAGPYLEVEKPLLSPAYICHHE